MRPINRIIIHHSESPGGNADMIRRWHTVDDHNWLDIGYHYVICNGKAHGGWKAGGDGEVQEGRPIDVQGAHARSANADSIGICLIGDFEKTFPSNKQMMGLAGLILDLCIDYHIKPLGGVLGHRDVGNTICPGKNLYRLLPSLRLFLDRVLVMWL